ncbi:Uncharacterized protein OBRU01_12217 [Operophtera brumata]|uniref:DUF4780 domain-containing protein n=1 Tax=Operophtera brumata TaxID=104452 RepID=A0A0L7LAJ7_OPEBR|nr:Uncharacterized protein OBRU01_12217 [Operophtera brumata]
MYFIMASSKFQKDTTCSCLKTTWTREDSDGSSTPSTCVLCSEDPSAVSRIDTGTSKTDIPDSKESKTTLTVSKSKQSECSKLASSVSKRSDRTSKKCEAKKCSCGSNMACDLKFRDFYAETDDEADETNRLIQMRNSDYYDIIDDELKVVVALAGYPKSKMRLRQMELFQRCLHEVLDMQSKAGLLLKVPAFFDYYLNRGAIVCICKDIDTKNWMVRISPGLQERMCYNLVLLNADVKRLCLAVLKIPRVCWPATAPDAFKLLQYFNPALKTNMWKIYAQKVVNDVECTSFLIDRVSGEIIRGPTFKNIIDYDQIEFELTGYTEIYYECLLSGMEEDLSSVTSRVKLLDDIKTSISTPTVESTISLVPVEVENKFKDVAVETAQEATGIIEMNESEAIYEDEKIDSINDQAHDVEIEEIDIKKELEISLQHDIMKKIKDVKYIGENDEVLFWSDETICDREDKKETEKEIPINPLEAETTTSLMALSEKSVSIIESNDNLLTKTSTVNIDSNRGIAYHRRTNYLHVENELKVAITLEGYPVYKLEGTHIRRLKHLFKEYLHKDMKSQRFTNMIIPQFQDIFLSNGAVIYICDSLETKDYLTEILPKFINSTGLKLTFRDVKNLVRYTRIVMRLPKEEAHIESLVILNELKEKYPQLNPSCWKYYSDVAGKQKREFGVDPESLEVIKSPDFDPTHEGQKLTFRIIDRQKRDISCDETTSKSEDIENFEIKKQREFVAKHMYAPIDPEIINAPLTRIRTNHYTDLIADDLKLYVGPTNYPDSRIDEVQFHLIKRTFESIVADSLGKVVLTEDSMPRFHDVYLFDGVIFIICKNMDSRIWIEKNVAIVNDKLKISLKSTEFRGAVGIVSLVVKTSKETDDVIAILQKQNPRLRTKYWRKISTVRTCSKLDVVLQIDKLSAQVITDPQFNKLIGLELAEFKLGHLRSLIKPKETLEALTKAKALKTKKKASKVKKVAKKKSKEVTKVAEKESVDERTDNNSDIENDKSPKIHEDHDIDPIIIEPDSPKHRKEFVIPDNCYQTKIVLKIPTNILPDSEDDLNIIFDILEDKNPGLNTEIWQIYSETDYPCNGKFVVYVDYQSLALIQSESFVPLVGGERLKFFF